jgi:hypothetical protein
VADDERAEVLKHPDQLVPAHVLVGLAVEVIGGAVDDVVGQPATPQRLKQGQLVQLVVFIVDDDEPLDVGMATKPFEEGVAPWPGRSGVVSINGTPECLALNSPAGS